MSDALHAREAALAAVLARALALALEQADGLLAVARDLDERVRDVLLAVVRDALALVAPLDHQDRPGAAHVVGLRLGRALHRVDVLGLEPGRQRLELLQAVLAARHVARALEVDELDLVLEAAHHLLRLVREAEALVLGEVEALRVARDEVVGEHQDAEHGDHQQEGVAAVLELPAAEPAHHVLEAQHQVDQHERRRGDQPRPQPPGQLVRPGRARDEDGPDGDQEPERREEVDELLQGAHDAQALHRWLSTDWWARKRPKPMTLR